MRSRTVDGKALQAAREKQGLTQVDLANRVHRSKDLISKIETGARQPSGASYLAIVSALNLPEGALLAADTPPAPPPRAGRKTGPKPTRHRCDMCGGAGTVPVHGERGKEKRCPQCKGNGELVAA
jgi:DNA-binding XRE family transcriptional regulator